MKWELKRDLFALTLILVYVVVCYYFYPLLPDQVAVHFNGHGMPDNYASKQAFAYFSVAMMVGIYLLLTFIPLIDPFRKKFESKREIFLFFRDIAMAFSFVMAIITAISARNGRLQTDLFAIAFGLLFIVLGNYLPRLPRNFFFGIRSPWTLASETVWVKTHRVSGWLCVVAGILFIVFCLVHVDFAISMPVVLVPLVAVTAFIYPYFLFRKLQKEDKV